MKIEEKPDHNADLADPGDRFQVVWRDVDPEAHEDADDPGAVRFQRLEGCDFSGGAFCSTTHPAARRVSGRLIAGMGPSPAATPLGRAAWPTPSPRGASPARVGQGSRPRRPSATG